MSGANLVSWASIQGGSKAGPGNDRSSSLNYPSPFLRFESYNLPNSLKSLFKLLSFNYLSDSNMNPTIENMAMFPVTEVLFTGDESKELKDKWSSILNDKMRFRLCAIALGLDFWNYGNAISSIFVPFIRHYICRTCKTVYSEKDPKTKWRFTAMEFMVSCRNRKCKGSWQEADAVDLPDKENVDGFRMIRWSVYDIELEHFPYSNEKDAFYVIPKSVIHKIKTGNKRFIQRTPIDIIKQAQYFVKGKGPNKLPLLPDNVKIIQREIASMPTGEQMAWGMPLGLSSLRQIYFKNLMIRAQAMVLHEHTIPFRVVFPQATSGDPLDIPAAEWKGEFQKQYRAWIRDPSTVMTSLLPMGVSQLGGQGKILTLFPEIDQVDRNITKGMNFPVGLLDGMSNYANSSVSMRLLENIMLNYSEHLNDVLKWTIKHVSAVTGLKEINAKLKPFKMADDVQAKGLYLNLHEKRLVSGRHMGSVFDFDYESEQKQISKEAVEMAKLDAESQAEGQVEMQRNVESLSNTSPKAFDNVSNEMDPEKITQMSEMLKQISPDKREQYLDQMQMQQPVLGSYMKDREKYSPMSAMKELMEMNTLPPELAQKKMEDISNQDPLKKRIMDIYQNSLNQQSQGGQQGNNNVDMRPPPEKLPPRRGS